MKTWKSITIFAFLFLLTGCGKNYQSSADAVAMEMANRLSQANYKNIVELINVPEGSFVDSKAFSAYLEDKGMKLAGNKKVELVKSATGSDTRKTVDIKIDNRKILSIWTVKKEEKWYVDLDNDFEEELVITVPKGSTVKLNDTVLNQKKAVTTKKTETIVYPSGWLNGYYDYPYQVDTYTIPSILKGNYNLVVSNDDCETYQKEIQTKDCEKKYNIKLKVNQKITEALRLELEANLNAVIQAKESGKEFKDVEKYYKLTTNYEQTKKKYDDISFEDNRYTLSKDRFSKVSLTNLKISEIYKLDNQKYIINGTFKLSYTRERTQSYGSDKIVTENLSKQQPIVAVIVVEDGKYKMEQGINLIQPIF